MAYQGGRHGHYEGEGEGEQGYGAPGYGGEGRGRSHHQHGNNEESGYGGQPNYGGYSEQGHGYGGESGQYNRRHEEEEATEEGYGHHRRPAQTSEIDESQQLFKIYCEANPDYFITVQHDGVVLAPGDESNKHQQFVKDCKWGSRVQDQAGSPAFAIVHKASGLALKHGTELAEKVTLQPYDPDVLDESVLWTQSDDVGNGYQCLRPVGNIHLNLDANHGERALRSGTELILFKWNKQENQKWKIVPVSKTSDYGGGSYERQGYGGGGGGGGGGGYNDY